METSRFQSQTVGNLRVVGSFDNNGTIRRTHRCWATFRKDESPTTAFGGGATGTRVMFAPARIYDYATSEPSINRAFAPPPNARIVAFTVAGKTVTDVATLAALNVNFASLPAGQATYTLGIQRCPLANSAGVEDKPSRDTTSAFTLKTHAFNATPASAAVLHTSGTRTAGQTVELAINAADVTNPYLFYYQFLSPAVQPGAFAANKHIGVVHEGIDKAFAQSGGTPLRFAWDAPPCYGANAITVTNPGLALVLLFSTNRTSATSTVLGTGTVQGDFAQSATLVDLTLDVTFELEIDKNNDPLNLPAYSNGAWTASEYMGIIE
jgi:hypothetical protein